MEGEEEGFVVYKARQLTRALVSVDRRRKKDEVRPEKRLDQRERNGRRLPWLKGKRTRTKTRKTSGIRRLVFVYPCAHTNNI